MSDVTIGRASGATPLFEPLTIALLMFIGIVGFAGTLMLGAYAPDLRGEANGGGHALSDSAIGYSGLVRLAGAMGRNPHVIRDSHRWSSETLVVATPGSGAVNVASLMMAARSRAVLIVLPKWQTVKDDDHPGWSRVSDLLPAADPEGMLAPATRLGIQRHKGGGVLTDMTGVPGNIHFIAPAKLQVITSALPPPPGDNALLQPLITDGEGDTVLGRLAKTNIYLLSDPDLLNNAGMKTTAGAASALALLDRLNRGDRASIGFDVTLNGLGSTPSPLKLAFDPPFLATTLTIAAAMLLLGIHAFGRFGAVRPPERAIAFGKAKLVDNSAALVSKARRAHHFGGRYVAVIRDLAVRSFGVSPRLKGAAIDAYLDGLGDGPRFTEMAAAAEAATDAQRLLNAARALHAWQQEKQA